MIVCAWRTHLRRYVRHISAPCWAPAHTSPHHAGHRHVSGGPSASRHRHQTNLMIVCAWRTHLRRYVRHISAPCWAPAREWRT
ncbi:Ca2+:H+ antiporter [Operophtera brumata]|uniref:Ca2+:H+ antiporter n=1 Tax=Operophtera brumata TaxID=104452 RepID=A0A0L7KRH5_OPEBR|nr:Ca2+:H+ antiporter [Operophtera brumata]